jgi:hypothetical protein
VSVYPSRVYTPGLDEDACVNCTEGPAGHRCIRLAQRGELSGMDEAFAFVKIMGGTYGSELGEMPDGFLSNDDVRMEKLRGLSQQALTACAVLGLSMYYGASGKMQ